MAWEAADAESAAFTKPWAALPGDQAGRLIAGTGSDTAQVPAPATAYRTLADGRTAHTRLAVAESTAPCPLRERQRQMQTVLFTKLFGDREVAEVADTSADLGFDGVDLLIRDGFTASPTSPADISTAVSRCREGGLSVPLATTDLSDPAAYPAQSVLDACAAAGIGTVRLGFWKYDPHTRVTEQIDRARRDLDVLGEIAERAGVRLALQLHGGTVHSSGALAHRLLDGRDPATFVAYPDPGNQVVQEGREDWRLTFDLLATWLGCVGVKNGGWYPAALDPSGRRAWASDWFGLGDGMVPWPAIIAHLRAADFGGVLTLHSPYALPYAQVLDRTRTDAAYIRRLMAG